MKSILIQYPLYGYAIILFLFSTNCNSDDDSVENPDDLPDQIELTENIEVYNSERIANGFVLGMINGGNECFLIDRTGIKVKEWTFENNLGNDIEILPTGQLLGIFKSEDIQLSLGGSAGIVRLMDSEGVTEWEYIYNTTDHILHHDVEPLPNGNILLMAWERIPLNNAQQLGSNSAVDIIPEVLLEINPTTDEIVWEWHSIDHIIQDVNPSAPSYGSINENPHLINLNYVTHPSGDIMHANGIDYDEAKDIIYISVNAYSEIWVIDHSTTTAQAASQSGGNYGKGGALLYRFGNPEAYNNTAGDRLFFNNHFPNLLENDEPGAGNVLVYMNGTNINQSTVFEFQMPETFNLLPNNNNEPNVVWSFTDPDLFYGRISGAVRLINGNTLICEGNYGFWEVTPDGEVVWKYNGLGPNFWRGYGYNQDDEAIVNLNL